MDIQNLTCTIRDRVVLDNVSLDFPAGEVTAIVGRNGAGKTTLLRCLSGRMTNFSGAFRHEGGLVDVEDDGWKRTIGVIPDSDALFDELTVEEQLTLAAELFGVSPDEQTERVGQLLQLSGLEDRRNALGVELSAGMRKRLAIALALIHGPRILLFDEPLNAMDYSSSETFISLIAYLRSVGRTVLLTGHVLEAIARVADVVIELENGRVFGSVRVEEQERSAERLLARLKTLVPEGGSARYGELAGLSWLER